MAYFTRRVLQSLLLLFGVSLLSFILIQLAPGDFFSEMRLNPQISPETVSALRTQYGMDRPLPVRYARWLVSVAHGEWGYSFAYNIPVAPLLWTRARNTLALTILSSALTWLLAIPLGVFAAHRRGKVWDRIAGAGSSILLSIPDVLLALAFLLLALRSHLFPVGGMSSLDSGAFSAIARLRDFLIHATLPVCALVLGSFPVIFRHVRAGMLEALASPSVRAARGLGIPPHRILFVYGLKAAANPLVSLLGLTLATLLSSSLLIETVMSWPGLGPLLLEAIFARDLFLVVGAVLLSTLFLVAGNFIADLLLYFSDPRIRGGVA
jgi:peptide/nickel transport system permease protein